MTLTKFYFYILVIVCTTLFSCSGKRSVNFHSDTQRTSNTGKVIGIFDGDTFDVLMDDKKKIRVRMAAIDAPEKGMPFYSVSKKYLSELCFNKEVRLVYIETDQFKRSINRAYLGDGTDLSKEMIRSGLAWHYKQFSSEKELSDLEITARNNKLGLWNDKKPMEPWLCRSLRRAGNHIEFMNDTIIIQPTRRK